MAGDDRNIDRRRFVKLAGASALAAPLAGLTACGGGEPASTPSAPAAESKPAEKPAPKPAMKETPAPAAEPKPAMADTSTMVKLEESDPQAMSLGYKHDAANVDLEKYPRRGTPEAANQFCRNCVLYSGAEGDEWGPCSIFAGKLVAAGGWCATYAPKG